MVHTPQLGCLGAFHLLTLRIVQSGVTKMCSEDSNIRRQLRFLSHNNMKSEYKFPKRYFGSKLQQN